jgi:hypothetical protein
LEEDQIQKFSILEINYKTNKKKRKKKSKEKEM